MKPITQLPDYFIERSVLDLSKDKRLLVTLQLAGLVVLLISSWFFIWLASRLRPEIWLALSDNEFIYRAADGSLVISFSLSLMAGVVLILSILVATVLMVVLHEAVHGLFFWFFTGRTPRFGFKGFYAYAAAAPGVYLPRNEYLVVGASPLVLLTLVGILVIPFIPLILMPALLFLLIGNASGSVGDILVIGWLLREPSEVLLLDVGDAMTSFGPSG
jgi:hypothetical protein